MKKDDFVSDPSVGIYYSPGTEVLHLAPAIGSSTAPKKVVKTDDSSGEGELIAPWGPDNDFPKKIDDALELNADLASGLDWQARALYAGGLGYEFMDLESGEVLPKRNLEIEKFLFRNQSYLMQASKDFYKYANVFPELKMDRAGNKIYWLLARPAGHCRLSKQSKDAKPKCYVNADFNEGADAKDTATFPVDVLDPYRDMPEEFQKKDFKDKSFMYPLSYASGKSNYQLATWNGIRENGWLDLANEIPKFKMALMKNQMTVKYHVQMPDYWMPWKYKGTWDKFGDAEKIKKTAEEIKKFDDFLKGSEKAGKSITTIYKTDAHTGKGWDGWIITPLDDKLKDGMYLEDSVEATIKIFSALGLDPALFGIIPGKGGSNRSGSDKREALNIYISLIQMHVDVLLRPYQFISWVNEWNNEKEMIRWFFKAPLLQTLDQVSPSKRETKIEDNAG